jgi:peptide/nickel transport system permease protein
MTTVPTEYTSRDSTRPRSRRFRVPVLIAACMGFLLVVVLCALFGRLLAPYDPDVQDLAVGLSTPSGSHWFGTDDLGRDIFSRVLVGSRTALLGPALIALGAMAIGSLLGLLAGYRRGAAETVIMRWVDLMYALPGLLIAIVVVGVLGGGYFLAVALLILLTSPYDTRLVRAATLEQRPLPYVEAARVLGLNDRRIMARHIWPNLLPVVLANTFLNFAFALVSLAALSYLGLGVGPGTADWGRMLSESRTLLFDNPVAALAPGGMIILTAAAMNLIGDWIFETLSERGQSR